MQSGECEIFSNLINLLYLSNFNLISLQLLLLKLPVTLPTIVTGKQSWTDLENWYPEEDTVLWVYFIWDTIKLVSLW